MKNLSLTGCFLLIFVCSFRLVKSDSDNFNYFSDGNVLVELARTAEKFIGIENDNLTNINSKCYLELTTFYNELRNNSLWAFKSKFKVTSHPSGSGNPIF